MPLIMNQNKSYFEKRDILNELIGINDSLKVQKLTKTIDFFIRIKFIQPFFS